MAECENHIYCSDQSISGEMLVNRLESSLGTLEEGMQLLISSSYISEHSLLTRMHNSVTQYLRLLMYGDNDCTIPPVAIETYILQHSTSVGRPKIQPNLDKMELLRGCGYTWSQVADALQVSRTTLWRRIKEANFEIKKYTDICDDELDSIVSQIQKENPSCGQQLINGHLRARGIQVQRMKLRESVRRTDPIRKHIRWHEVLSRRTYSVKQSNSLWHIDGHHSLIRWRIVIHGGIDGYSRLVVYLACSTNNRASTVYKLFKAAVKEYGIPSRVRSDKGGENILVCHFMVTVCGTGRGSHIAGSSVHNQRIERLWRDVYRCVCSTYHELFYAMEAMGVLNPDDDVDLFVLHCVYLSRINKSLSDFTTAWNLHPMRTERNWSPRQIMINSLIQQAEISSSAEVPDDFGVDYEGPIPQDEPGTVDVPSTDPPLSESDLQEFLSTVDTESFFDDFGLQHYISCRQSLLNMLQ